jgi:hypothetical protein
MIIGSICHPPLAEFCPTHSEQSSGKEDRVAFLVFSEVEFVIANN